MTSAAGNVVRREIRHKGGALFSSALVANWSVGVENTKRLSNTVRSQKPFLKFTRTFAEVYSEAVSTQDSVVPTRETPNKVRNERRKNRLSGLLEAETRQ